VERAWETPVVATYGAMLLLFGLLTSWAAPACNNPIFAEIVPPSLRNIVYAFDRCVGAVVGGAAGGGAGGGLLGSPRVGCGAGGWVFQHLSSFPLKCPR
jgi:hypothetical protein